MLSKLIKQLNEEVKTYKEDIDKVDNPHTLMYYTAIIDVIESVTIKLKDTINNNLVVATKQDYRDDYAEGIVKGFNIVAKIIEIYIKASDNEPKFKKGEVVIYQNGNNFELGIINTVRSNKTYFVNYHTGDTTALTNEENLHRITNAYAFNIIRKLADEDKALKAAEKILEELNQTIEAHLNVPLTGDSPHAILYEEAVEKEDSTEYIILKVLKEIFYGKCQ